MRPFKSPLSTAVTAAAVVAVAASIAVSGAGIIGTSNAGATVRTDRGISNDSPTQILAAAQKALRSLHGYVVSGTVTQSGKAEHVRVVEQSSSRLEEQFDGAGLSFDLRVLSDHAYLLANRAYWKAQQGSAAAQHFGGHWTQIPVKLGRYFVSGRSSYTPKKLAQCLGEDRGVLTRAGTTTINGQPAVVIRDEGNVPGGNPGTYAIASTGTPYLLRVSATGPTRSGGKIDRCNSGKAEDAEGSLTLSEFNNPPAVVGPKSPIRRIYSAVQMTDRKVR